MDYLDGSRLTGLSHYYMRCDPLLTSPRAYRHTLTLRRTAVDNSSAYAYILSSYSTLYLWINVCCCRCIHTARRADGSRYSVIIYGDWYCGLKTEIRVVYNLGKIPNLIIACRQFMTTLYIIYWDIQHHFYYLFTQTFHSLFLPV